MTPTQVRKRATHVWTERVGRTTRWVVKVGRPGQRAAYGAGRNLRPGTPFKSRLEAGWAARELSDELSLIQV